MKLKEVIELLVAETIYVNAKHLELDINSTAASDLMSDILARPGTPDLMMTGLATVQAVRTASIAGIKAVMIVRGKPINAQMIELAKDDDIPLMVTKHSLFDASGKLWECGVRSGLQPE
ncbi:MAG: transcriptional regulator [Candidatus Krumholzibacteria bacterium]|nr:transcriptional regulator [Candidatus Krumholzibacteria bacterium]